MVFLVLGLAPFAQALAVTLTLSSARVQGGEPVSARLALPAAAPAGGVTVTLSSGNANVTFADPATLVPVTTVQIPQGQTRRDLAIRSAPVAAATSVQLTAATSTGRSSATLALMPPIPRALNLGAPAVAGGSPVPLTLTLSGAAPAGGLTVTITSSAADVAAVASPVTIRGGQSSVTVQATTFPVAAPVTVSLAAGGATAALKVQPPAVRGVQLASPSVVGGDALEVMVTLTGPAPKGGFPVSFVSTVAAIDTRTSLTFPPGAASARVRLPTRTVAAPLNAQLTANAATSAAAATLTLYPPAVTSVALSVPRVAGLATLTATVSTSHPAPGDGLPVSLSVDGSQNGAAVVLPAAVTVPAGQTTVSFPVEVRVPDAGGGVATIVARTSTGSSQAALTLFPLRVKQIAASVPVAADGDPVTFTITRNGVPVDPNSTSVLKFSAETNRAQPCGAWGCGPESWPFTDLASSVAFTTGNSTTASVTVGAPTVGSPWLITAREVGSVYGMENPSASFSAVPLPVTQLEVRRCGNGAVQPELVQERVHAGEALHLTLVLARPPVGRVGKSIGRVITAPLDNACGLAPSPSGTGTLMPVVEAIPGDPVIRTAVMFPITSTASQQLSISVIGHETEQEITLWVDPPAYSLALESSSVRGGEPACGTISVQAPPVAVQTLVYPIETSNPAAFRYVPTAVSLSEPYCQYSVCHLYRINAQRFCLTTAAVAAPTEVAIKAGGEPGNFSSGAVAVLTVTP